MPITFVSVVVNDWLLPDWACAFSAFVDNTILFASVWTVAVCSFDRYHLQTIEFIPSLWTFIEGDLV